MKSLRQDYDENLFVAFIDINPLFRGNFVTIAQQIISFSEGRKEKNDILYGRPKEALKIISNRIARRSHNTEKLTCEVIISKQQIKYRIKLLMIINLKNSTLSIKFKLQNWLERIRTLVLYTWGQEFKSPSLHGGSQGAHWSSVMLQIYHFLQ